MEGLALDRPPLEHAPLRHGSSRSRRAASSARSVGGTTTSPASPPRSASISSTNSGLPPAARAILSRSSGANPLGDQLVDVFVAAAARASGDRPRRRAARRAPAGRRRAAGSGARREQRDVLDEVEERLLAPLDVVEDDDQWPVRGACSSVLRNAQAISSADVAASVSPSSDRIAATAVSSAGSTSSCLSTSTTGQYVIPSPYGRHRPSNDACLAATEPTKLRDESRLADAGVADDRDQLAPFRSAPARSQAARSARARAARPTNGASMASIGRVVDAEQPVGRDGLAPCPSARAARPARRRRRRGRGRASARRSAPRRVRPPAPAGPRR